MSLELLTDRKITNFSELQPVEPRPERTALEHFKKLQQSRFFDPKNHQWLCALDVNWDEDSNNRRLDDQIIGVLVNSELFGNKQASDIFRQIENKYYIKDKFSDDRKWIKSLENNNETGNPTSSLFDLTITLAKAKLFGKEQAAAEYINYKMECYKTESNGEIMEYSINTYSKLLFAWIESLLYGKQKGDKLYQAIKKDRYDNKTLQWKSDKWDMERTAKDQLLSLVIEAELYGKDNLKNNFNKVKEHFYDKNTDSWFSLYNTQTISNPYNYIKDQLLAVLIEKKLEKQEAFSFTNPLPEVRRF